MKIKECIKYVYEPKDKDERKNRICQLIAEWLTENATENKMAFVAAMFGKQMGEEFSVEFVYNRNLARCCCFKADGLFCEDRGPCETMLNNLLTGKVVIVDD